MIEQFFRFKKIFLENWTAYFYLKTQIKGIVILDKQAAHASCSNNGRTFGGI